MLANSMDHSESLMAEEPGSHGNISPSHASVIREEFARTLEVHQTDRLYKLSSPSASSVLDMTFATHKYQGLAPSPCLPESRTAS